MSGGTTRWVSRRGIAVGRQFPRASILPESFDGRERSGEPQGCCVMGGKYISHDRNTPGGPDQPSNILGWSRGSPSERNGAWELTPVISMPC